MTSWKYDIVSEIQTGNHTNNPAKIHPNLIWNERALGFIEQGYPNKNNNNTLSTGSDIYWTGLPKQEQQQYVKYW